MQHTVPIPRNGADRVPGLKGYPIVGNLPQFQRDPLAALTRAAREGGDASPPKAAAGARALPTSPLGAARACASATTSR